MGTLRNRLNVAFSLLSLQSRDCPYCQNRTRKIGSNATLSHVRTCESCGLAFRWPRQSPFFNRAYYQLTYAKTDFGPNVDAPPEDQVPVLVQRNFEGHPNCLGVKLDIVRMLQTGKRMLVYGASWGYEVVQFTHAGLDATGFEVSTPRAKFGERLLGCRIYDREQDLVGLPPFDVCYASHVLEHLPAPQVALGLFAKVMASGSWLVVFVPNCGGKSAREKGVKWGPFSSEAHPMSYTSEFFKKALPSFGFCEVFCFSDPYEVSSMFRAGTPRQDGCLDGDELLVLARKS